MADCGYPDPEIAKTRRLTLKKNLHSDSKIQLLEDVIYLVIMATYLLDFSNRSDGNKVIGIFQKTWVKMIPQATR